ncbi:MAG: trypsin-like peptidase domain-containing protein [Oscillospiraceae bacterium]|nr:trypsin-like peptidase domain-containing protein [Oscillospiraceae bacterium]
MIGPKPGTVPYHHPDISGPGDDLAVIRFFAEEDPAVITVAASDPEKDDRIMCVGNPQNDWFAISYGKVTSGIETFGEFRDFPSNGMKHTAYIQARSSGGAAIGEQMQLVGIAPGVSLSLDGKKFHDGVLVPVSEINRCLDEWNRR